MMGRWFWRSDTRCREHVGVDFEQRDSAGDGNGGGEQKALLGSVDNVPEHGIDQGKGQGDLHSGLPGGFALCRGQ